MKKKKNTNCGIFLLICRPETSVKPRLVVQHGISTLRALDKHGLQPALIIYWAKTLQKTVS